MYVREGFGYFQPVLHKFVFQLIYFYKPIIADYVHNISISVIFRDPVIIFLNIYM